MRSCFYIWILFFCCSNLLAQEKSETDVEIQRLEFIINDPESHDTSKAFAWKELAEILYLYNLDTIFPLCNKSKQIATEGMGKTNNPQVRNAFRTCISGCYNNIGYAYSEKGNSEEALINYSAGLRIQTEIGDLEGAAISLNNIGQIYDRKGELEKALNYYHESLLIQEQIGDNRGIAISLNNIGIIYKNQGNYQKALEYYQLSYQLRETNGNKRGMSISLNNMGTLYNDQGDFETALMYYQKSLDLRNEISDNRGKAHTLHNIGGVYLRIGELENALEFFREELELTEELGMTEQMAEAKVDVGEVYFLQGYIEPARLLVDEALDTFISLGYPKKIERSASLLAQILEAQNKHQQALEMYKLGRVMEDSLRNDELQKAVVTQQAKYTYEKQKAIDQAEHEKELIIQQEEKRIQNILTYSIGGGFVLLTVFVIFIFNRLKITRKQKDEIEEQKSEIEEKNQEIMDSINYAQRIQNAILPSDELMQKHLNDHFVLYRPKDVVAGDFYWLHELDDSVLFAVSDCTGHGVPGAMVSVVCSNSLNRAVREFGLSQPSQILDKTKELVVEEFNKNNQSVRDGMDIALVSLELSKNTSCNLQFSGANNSLWIIKSGSKDIMEFKADKQPIGKYESIASFTNYTYELQKGDRVYLFSDGFADQFGGPSGKKFKSKNLKQLLIDSSHLGMNEQKEYLWSSLSQWMKGHEQLDDICLIGFQY